MSRWEENAKTVVEMCGEDFVNWQDRYYFCPECGEPIFDIDWTEHELTDCLCPICTYYEGD